MWLTWGSDRCAATIAAKYDWFTYIQRELLVSQNNYKNSAEITKNVTQEMDGILSLTVFWRDTFLISVRICLVTDCSKLLVYEMQNFTVELISILLATGDPVDVDRRHMWLWTVSRSYALDTRLHIFVCCI